MLITEHSHNAELFLILYTFAACFIPFHFFSMYMHTFNIVGNYIAFEILVFFFFQFMLYMRICQSSFKHMMKCYAPQHKLMAT